MRARYLAAATAVWVTAYLLVYVALIDQQGDTPVAWWYVALVGVAGLFLAGAAIRRAPMFVLILAVAALAVSMIIALASIGLLLLPAVLGAAAVIGLGGAERQG
ncbi:hypothetical protein [Oryzihumus leptocrescens]|uniref:Uncharacterized protein n=1 Tax=Oryzihumus leptocrescens TaxID=297536 RepID=A0A542ZH11_9MICO|nr:hypothetical protein [Oryzihumus leptocrescens]TQL59614.1 hypothetical protein FB474_0976 [Oryzihumus leptocrescens]